MHLEARNIGITLCQNYRDQLRLLEVTQENLAVIFLRHCVLMKQREDDVNIGLCALITGVHQMHLIRLWIWMLPVILVTAVIVNVYLLSYLHGTKCECLAFAQMKVLIIVFQTYI